MKRAVIVFILVPAFLSGCVVSKKKYEAMVSERDLLQQHLTDTRTENKELRNNLEKAISDFEAMKFELHQSNALKSDKVSQLVADSEKYQKEAIQLQKELENTRRRFLSQQATSAQRAEELESLKRRVSQLTTDTASLRHALQMSKERQSGLRDELRGVRDRYNQLAAEHAQKENEMAQTEQKLATLEQQIVEKSQTLADISSAFVALRKEMLSARSEGNPIDPNQNKNIDRIARLLGHY